MRVQQAPALPAIVGAKQLASCIHSINRLPYKRIDHNLTKEPTGAGHRHNLPMSTAIGAAIDQRSAAGIDQAGPAARCGQTADLGQGRHVVGACPSWRVQIGLPNADAVAGKQAVRVVPVDC
jgi:hypothetical protein